MTYRTAAAPSSSYLWAGLHDDATLADLPIEVRNLILGSPWASRAEFDAFNEAQDEAAEKAEGEAERRTERWFEERGGSTYAGSFEEAQDRYLDGLVGR